jgi:hypothetical protein
VFGNKEEVGGFGGGFAVYFLLGWILFLFFWE